eukprot:TRINITY_DN5539_c0_g1_i1.p2 TRINITY_DN5539_c0_g1~~TRINITY_DN5539_c0_g1_i1.p2  ORF type:complete len:158 (-),score=11.38 TRINITY_DN5539_c0_g1_i1:35-481(-)
MAVKAGLYLCQLLCEHQCFDRAQSVVMQVYTGLQNLEGADQLRLVLPLLCFLWLQTLFQNNLRELNCVVEQLILGLQVDVKWTKWMQDIQTMNMVKKGEKQLGDILLIDQSQVFGDFWKLIVFNDLDRKHLAKLIHKYPWLQLQRIIL